MYSMNIKMLRLYVMNEPSPYTLIYRPVQFEALRRVHLIPSEETPAENEDTINANVFRNLDSMVSEGGENFSTG
jgi:hypothetical protein